MVRNIKRSKCDHSLKHGLFVTSLTFLSICILQLCLGLTVKRHSSKHNSVCKQRIDTISSNDTHRSKCFAAFHCFYAKFTRKMSILFEKEAWGILLLLLVKDVPFSILRTYALIVPKNCELWNQSIFFTLKNYVTIIIQLNRCYVLVNKFENAANESHSHTSETLNVEQHSAIMNQNNANKFFSRKDSIPPFSVSMSSSSNAISTSSTLTSNCSFQSNATTATNVSLISNGSLYAATSSGKTKIKKSFLSFGFKSKSNKIVCDKKTQPKNLDSITELSDSSSMNNNHLYL